MIVEAPDDATVMTSLLGLCHQGNVRTTTMRAFGAAEMERILATMK
ncbi:MAG: GYD domain-containing protein [Chloroflexi bacterium]|nr:GYD domain-containing protein [Chloroflexota bacterium]